MAPIRLKNLVGLHIDDHIQRTRASDGTVHLVIPGEQVKNGEPLDYCLPRETTELLDTYIRDFRPRLLRPRTHGSSLDEQQTGQKATINSAFS